MTRTYGTLGFDPAGRLWLVQAEPAVAMRVKRTFGRVRTSSFGTLTIGHTIEVARDLEWFLERFPLVVEPEARELLAMSAAAHRQREVDLARVLTSAPTLRLGPEVGLTKTPRPYQLAAAELLRTRHRYLLGDEVGLGKTLTGLLNLVHEDALPALVVTPTHLPTRWATELAESLPGLSSRIVPTTKPEQAALDGVFPDVTIVPYSRLAGWQHALAGRMRSVVFDEVQDLRRGTDSKKGTAAAHIAREATFVLGLTATPVYNYGGEIWNLLDIIAPGELGSYDEFGREWGRSFGSHMGVGDPKALGSYLREQGLLLARTRTEVGRDLPKTVKVPHTVPADTAVLDEIAGDVAEMARLILSADTNGRDRWKAAGEMDWKLRQQTGIAKAPFVAEFVRMLLESEAKVTLFGWHRAVWDLWMHELADFNPILYTGTESPTQKAAAEERFKTDPTARILMMSLRSGAGVDGLQKVCSVAVFGELDWSPQVHEQAIGRFRRDGMDETKPVVAYFLTADEGADPAILEALQLKRNQAEPIISPDGELLQSSTQDISRGRRLAQQVLAAAGETVTPTTTPELGSADYWAVPIEEAARA